MANGQSGQCSLIVYDILGWEVVRLVDDHLESGYHQIQWDGRDQQGRSVPSGIYIARMVTPGYSKAIEMVRVR